MRYLGVDPGERRIGLAISDEEGRIALPRQTLDAGPEIASAEAIATLVASEAVGCVVVGLPLRMDGTEGASARRSRRLAAAIERKLDVPVVLWDERLTTVTAERSLRALGVRGAKRKKVVDQSAAAVLLQSYLDARHGRSWEGQDIGDFEDPGGGRPDRRRSRGR